MSRPLSHGVARPGPGLAMPRPGPAETKRLAAVAKRVGGLHLNPSKIDFFSQRLKKRLMSTGKTSYRDYCDYLESDAGRSEVRCFIEAMTTHTTSFFREAAHFDWLARQGWEALVDAGAGEIRPLRVWSAACSHGAELYSTLISLKEFEAAQGKRLRMEGVGTDLSQAVLAKAERAVFSGSEIKGLSAERQRTFLLRKRDGQDIYRIVPDLRRLTRWSRANLTKLGSDGPDQADLILLRNVLIYFDPATQARVVESLCGRLRSGGLLMTGHSEPLSAPPDGMKPVASSTYRKDA